jgi:hypothetical protein
MRGSRYLPFGPLFSRADLHLSPEDQRLLKSIDALLQNLLSLPQTVTLAIDEPRIKPFLTQSLSAACIQSGHQLHYVDFDLQFSSMLQNLSSKALDEMNDGGNLDVFQPREGEQAALEVIDHVESLQKVKQGGLVMLDSLNTLQNMLWKEQSPTAAQVANHKSAILITVLEQFAKFYSKTLLIVNITRSRPKTHADGREEQFSVVWEKEIVGGRMLRYKSNAVLFATGSYDSSLIPAKARIEIIVAPESEGPLASNKAENYFVEIPIRLT